MKLRTLINGRRAFMPAVNEKISTRLAYKIYKFIKRVETIDLPFYQDKLRMIIEKYATKGDDGRILPNNDGNVPVTEDKQQEYFSELSELENLETDYDSALFTLDELSELKLSVADMFKLEELIAEEEQA